MYGSHVFKARSRSQATVALSSAEAELYNSVRASSETLGLVALFLDLGIFATGHVLVDASAALAIIQRSGVGKVRHIHTQWLWVQGKSASKVLAYEKVHCSSNSADLMTKAFGGDRAQSLSRIIGAELHSGTDDSSPTIHHIGSAIPERKGGDCRHHTPMPGWCDSESVDSK